LSTTLIFVIGWGVLVGTIAGLTYLCGFIWNRVKRGQMVKGLLDKMERLDQLAFKEQLFKARTWRMKKHVYAVLRHPSGAYQLKRWRAKKRYLANMRAGYGVFG
jgi:hypothetical protein